MSPLSNYLLAREMLGGMQDATQLSIGALLVQAQRALIDIAASPLDVISASDSIAKQILDDLARYEPSEVPTATRLTKDALSYTLLGDPASLIVVHAY